MGEEAENRPWLPTFSEEVGVAICDWLIEGKSLRSFCEQEGAPTKSTVLRWAFHCPRWADQYARAREISGETDADDVAHYSRQAATGELDAKQASAAIMGLKWSAGQRRPKVYGTQRVQAVDDAGRTIVYNSPSEGD